MESAGKTAASRFFEESRIYDQILAHNSMHHDDIFRDLEKFFADRYGARPLSILDLGCGSAQHLAQALKGRWVASYVGYDLAETALVHASRNLAELGCPVDLRLGDLLDGFGNGEQKFGSIFCSFALHHLSSSGKREFFRSAHGRLVENGILLLIDTMRDPDEDRTVYLQRYCAWLRSRCPMLSEEAFDLLAAHIRDNDFPETTADLREMARSAGFAHPLVINRFGWHHAWCFCRQWRDAGSAGD